MKSSFKISSLIESYPVKALLLVGLCYVLTFPLQKFEEIIEQRQTHYTSLKKDLRENWGGKQALTGPLLIVPYERHESSVNTITDEKGQSKILSKNIFTEKTLLILPERLNIEGQVDTEFKQSGINKALVYSAAIKLSGKFNMSQLMDECQRNCKILWNKAWLSIALKDTKTILDTSNLQWASKRLKLRPGSSLEKLVGNGFHAKIDGVKPKRETVPFQLDLILTGSNQLSIAPIGEVTKLNLTTNWPTPEFIGGILPEIINEENTNGRGLSATWEIPSLARNYPQYREIDLKNIDKAERAVLDSLQVGIQIESSVERYSNTLKLSQYALLFPILTFLCLFIVESNSQRKIPLSHYLLTGLLLGLFYLLLAALAEHREYLEAYYAAAGSITIIIFLTTWLNLRRFWPSLLLLILTSGLYAVFYSHLYFPDLTLLVAASLFIFVTSLLLVSNRKTKPS
ncbi:MAG: inner membrane CreD family protein [Thiotrichaceae bacterium]|nr:inner membrane CreD family protein [Thiotrichaceae bacterium]